MDRHPSARHSSVVVLVVELTVYYDITVVRGANSLSRPHHPTPTCTATPCKTPTSTKPRPVAIIKPATGHRISQFPEANTIQEIPINLIDKSEVAKRVVTKEAVKKEITTPGCIRQEPKCSNKDCDANVGIFHKTRSKIIVDENCNNVFETSKVIINSVITESKPEENINFSPEEHLTAYKPTVTQERRKFVEVDTDPLLDYCKTHRDCVREASRNKQLVSEARKMEGCQGDQGCGEAMGCYQNGTPDWAMPHKETPFTECLNEFLEGLHLAHLADYLRVLGCTCVRDLRLLEKEELNAIQLISRRRLLQQLESVNLHHEAPPPDCPLDGWLTWYGLTHISGFLAAIGVHSVADLAYLKEEDLLLLKPVTRRRILTCNRK